LRFFYGMVWQYAPYMYELRHHMVYIYYRDIKRDDLKFKA
jgi:hypothetical protein